LINILYLFLHLFKKNLFLHFLLSLDIHALGSPDKLYTCTRRKHESKLVRHLIYGLGAGGGGCCTDEEIRPADHA
jgi:hypothetical protein